MQKNIYEFVYTQTGENIIEWKQCDCGEEFPITDKDIEFYEKVSPIIGGQKYTIPAPTKCPDCRQQRRLAFRNDRKLYKRNCDLTGKPIISIYSPQSGYVIYAADSRWSDKWDAMDYGREFDFTKTFNEQFDLLNKSVPKIALNGGNNNENSDYNNYVGNSKNCYLNFGIDSSENTLYSNSSSQIRDSLDVSNCNEISNSAYVWQSGTCSSSAFVESSAFVHNCFFAKGTNNVNGGIFCVNVSNKNFVFKNNQLEKTEFETMQAQIKEQLKTHSGLQKLVEEFEEFVKQFPVLAAVGGNSENCHGSLINNSRNCSFCFSLVGANDCKYSNDSVGIADTYDVDISGNSSINMVETLNVYGCSNVYFSEAIFENSRDVLYSNNCANNCSNLFGCVGLKNKQYCVFNKQYSKQEYEQLVPKIIEHMIKTGEWGEYFDASISPFGYNDTIANDFYPVKLSENGTQMITQDGRKLDVKLMGKESFVDSPAYKFKRQDVEYPVNVPAGTQLLQASDLPDSIEQIDDSILKVAIVCEKSGKPFRIVPMELQFYRKQGLPIPHEHPDVRYLDRISKRAPRKLFLVNCRACNKQVLSVYPQDGEYKILCEECFRKENFN